MLSLGTINAFSNVIYPNIKFAYGGGQPYQKTIEYVDNGRTLNYEKVLIYYENDSWIYFEEDGRVIALPKTSISRIVNESIKN